ncbi:hypothetical protein LPW11_06835 [Geomonas sp. RF6]|uniref:hypothetical protein n=1 Tax=Geomonas sp. RF6 TaxID=2897342 RepID=UPI001E65488C|nr:hypothetical protein [Geomonas sp. RF6]UFS71901.1 hypothetical protein LPW11_06835 [Geomonas sp. RF6]
MPKVYPAPKEAEKGGSSERDSGVKKTFGVYDKPARTRSPAMIAMVVIAAIIILFIVYMLMRQ